GSDQERCLFDDAGAVSLVVVFAGHLQPPTMKERSSNLNNNLSVEELFLALSGRQSGRNTAAVQQIAHEPVVLSPVVGAARHVMGAQRAVPRDSDTARCAKAHRSTA